MKFRKDLIEKLAAGEIVLHNEPKNPEAVKEILKEAFPNDKKGATGASKCYYYTGNAFGYANWGGWDEMLESPCMPSVHVSDFILPEHKFTVGQQYEFFNGVTWHKGEFVTAVDGKAKRYFLGILGGCTGEALFEDIREIQSKEVIIERWINMSQSGNQVGKKCFESEMEACQHAPQSQNVFQVKLTGTYTI